MTEEVDFIRRVESWIELLVQQGERDFANLVRRLPGVDPILTIETLERLSKSVRRDQFRELCDQARRLTIDNAQVVIGSFVPHPLDFDWRFTADSADDLVHQVLSLTQPERVALLGTPTLIPAIERRVPPQAVRLFDKNALWRNQVNSKDPRVAITTCDLTQDDFGDDALAKTDVVIMDPPWYPAIQRGYIWAASQLVRPGGFVVTTIPPKGTRPGLHLERAEMEGYAVSAGLAPITSSEGTVRYVTPPFEANALRAAQILRALPDWRTGDVAIYRSQRACMLDRPKVTRPESVWAEVMIRGVRIKMRLNSEQAADVGDSPELLPLVAGDVLASVSSRHPLRREVDVWTSGNRIFKCKNTRALLELCESLRDNMACAGGTIAGNRATSQVLALVAVESSEYLFGQ